MADSSCLDKRYGGTANMASDLHAAEHHVYVVSNKCLEQFPNNNASDFSNVIPRDSQMKLYPRVSSIAFNRLTISAPLNDELVCNDPPFHIFNAYNYVEGVAVANVILRGQGSCMTLHRLINDLNTCLPEDVRLSFGLWFSVIPSTVTPNQSQVVMEGADGTFLFLNVLFLEMFGFIGLIHKEKKIDEKNMVHTIVFHNAQPRPDDEIDEFMLRYRLIYFTTRAQSLTLTSQHKPRVRRNLPKYLQVYISPISSQRSTGQDDGGETQCVYTYAPKYWETETSDGSGDMGPICLKPQRMKYFSSSSSSNFVRVRVLDSNGHNLNFQPLSLNRPSFAHLRFREEKRDIDFSPMAERQVNLRISSLDGKATIFPDNTLTDFKVEVVPMLRFINDGGRNWSCRLDSITFPCKFTQLHLANGDDIKWDLFKNEDDGDVKQDIDQIPFSFRQFYDAHHLIDTLNMFMPSVTLRLNSSGFVQLSSTFSGQLSLPQRLAVMLGDDMKPGDDHTQPHVYNFDDNNHTILFPRKVDIFLYSPHVLNIVSDVVRPSIIGQDLHQTLAFVNTNLDRRYGMNHYQTIEPVSEGKRALMALEVSQISFNISQISVPGLDWPLFTNVADDDEIVLHLTFFQSK